MSLQDILDSVSAVYSHFPPIEQDLKTENVNENDAILAFVPSASPTPTPTPSRMVLQRRQGVVTVTSTRGSGPSGSSSSSSGSGTSPFPVGAMVGGLVGGIAIVSLIGGTWWYCYAKSQKEKAERRERRQKKRAAAAANRSGRPSISSRPSANSLVSLSKPIHVADEKIPPVPPVPSAYTLPLNNDYNQQPQDAYYNHQQQQQQQQQQYAYQSQDQQQQQNQYYAHEDPYGDQHAVPDQAYGQAYPPYDDRHQAQQEDGERGSMRDPSSASGSGSGAAVVSVVKTPSSTSKAAVSAASSSSDSSSSPSSQPSSKSKDRRRSRYQPQPTLDANGNPLAKYQPAKPSPLAAGAPVATVVRAEERKSDGSEPKWGAKPFKRISQISSHSADDAKELRLSGDHQQQQQYQQPNAEYLRGDGHGKGEEEVDGQNTRVTSGQWGVAYTADEPVQQEYRQHPQAMNDPYAQPNPSAPSPTSGTGQRKVTPGYPHFTLDDGQHDDAYDMAHVGNDDPTAMAMAMANRHRSTGDQSEDSFQYDSPYYQAQTEQAQHEVLSDPSGGTGRQKVDPDAYAYGSTRGRVGSRG